MCHEKLIVQITGEAGAGKSASADYLAETYGFRKVVVSDMIRAFAIPRGLPLSERSDYKHAHTELIRQLGKHAIPDEIIGLPASLVCVDGIRVPAHAARMRGFGPIVSLECPPRLRFERALSRTGTLDKPVFEDFVRDDIEESRSDDPYVQSTHTVMEMADYRVDSSVPFDAVAQELDEIIRPHLL